MSGSSKKTIPDFDLKGHFLIAMPGMEDLRFSRSLILICSHSKEGSMGFILNQPVASPKFGEILRELEIEANTDDVSADIPVFRGGPVEQGRGYIIHSLEHSTSASTRIDDLACISATLDVLKKIVSVKPPEKALMLLGYAGWAEGQLEEEIAQNGWLTMPATSELLFHTHHSLQYSAALAHLGISEELLSSSSGHA